MTDEERKALDQFYAQMRGIAQQYQEQGSAAEAKHILDLIERGEVAALVSLLDQISSAVRNMKDDRFN